MPGSLMEMARREKLLRAEWTEEEWEKLPEAPPLVPAYQAGPTDREARPTALDHARECWRRERWGEPLSYGQERMWTLFFTSQEPHEKLIQKSWTRPDRWVEDLIRYGPLSPLHHYPPRRHGVHREVVLAI